VTSNTFTSTKCVSTGFIITDMAAEARTVQNLVHEILAEDTHNEEAPNILAIWLPVPEPGVLIDGVRASPPLRTVDRTLVFPHGLKDETREYSCFMEFQYKSQHMTALVPGSSPDPDGTFNWESPTRIDDSNFVDDDSETDWASVAAFYVETSSMKQFYEALNPFKKLVLLSKSSMSLQKVLNLPPSQKFCELPGEVLDLIRKGVGADDRFKNFAPLPRKGAASFTYPMPEPEEGRAPRLYEGRAPRFNNGKYSNTCYQNVVLQLLNRITLLQIPDPTRILQGRVNPAPHDNDDPESATTKKTSSTLAKTPTKAAPKKTTSKKA
jgi:hypothetical protein